jgi:hypothetical protein
MQGTAGKILQKGYAALLKMGHVTLEDPFAGVAPLLLGNTWTPDFNFICRIN